MKIVPTETIGFHSAILALIFSAWFCRVDKLGWCFTIAFGAFAIASYWAILLVFRRSGRLVRWWHGQVTDRSRARFSVGIAVSFLSTFHILLFFAAVFLIIAHLFFAFEPAGASWGDSLSATFEAASIKGFAAVTPKTGIGRALLASASMLGLVFTALWVTIFMKAFDAVFKFDR